MELEHTTPLALALHLMNQNQIKEETKNESNRSKLMLSKRIGKLKVANWVSSLSCFYTEDLRMLFHLASLKTMFVFENKRYRY